MVFTNFAFKKHPRRAVCLRGSGTVQIQNNQSITNENSSAARIRLCPPPRNKIKGRNSRTQDDVIEWPLPRKIIGCASDRKLVDEYNSETNRCEYFMQLR